MRFKPRWEFVISGSGGQGILLAGALLVAGAAYDDRLFVAQSQTYGAQQRGGFSRSDVIISKEPILFPVVTDPDLTVILSREAWQRSRDQQTAGLVICDRDEALLGKDEGRDNFLSLPLRREAREAGNPRGLNILVAGLIIGYSYAVPDRYVEKALAGQFQGEVLEKNRAAFRKGLAIGREIGGGR